MVVISPWTCRPFRTRSRKPLKLTWENLRQPLSISAANQHLIFGRPETEIHALAEQIGADLIVVGSHGRTGLALLLGSTANGVLHGATCDVLAVRVGT